MRRPADRNLCSAGLTFPSAADGPLGANLRGRYSRLQRLNRLSEKFVADPSVWMAVLDVSRWRVLRAPQYGRHQRRQHVARVTALFDDSSDSTHSAIPAAL